MNGRTRAPLEIVTRQIDLIRADNGMTARPGH